MNWSGRSAVVFYATSWVARLVTLHLAWLGLTLAGGVVLGAFPASYVLLVAQKRELDGQPLSSGDLWRLFRANFWRANAFGYATGILIAGGLAEMLLLPRGEVHPLVAMIVPITTLWISYWTINAWVLLADAEELSLESTRRTVPLILLHPLRSISLLLCLGLAILGFALLPALAVAAGSSIVTLILMKVGRGASTSPQPTGP